MAVEAAGEYVLDRTIPAGFATTIGEVLRLGWPELLFPGISALVARPTSQTTKR
jgi:hypothetical protein